MAILALPDLAEMRRTIRAHQGSAPVQLVPMARDLGIDVYRAGNWPDNVSGFIRRKPDDLGRFEIFVNARHPRRRRRFTIAHEIAHAVLHGDRIGDGITEDGLLRSGLPDAIETQANKMAADILMPWHLLRPMISQSDVDTEELARIFDVSRQAMAIRLGVPQN